MPGAKKPWREADHYVHLVPRLRMRGAIHPLPNTPSSSCAQLKKKHRDNFTFILLGNIYQS